MLNILENNYKKDTLYFKTKQIIKKYEFLFKKNFGQNFLIDKHVLNKIINASNISKDDIIIEIGPGIGTLTSYIAKNAFKVIAIEIDRTLIPILKDTLSNFNNIEIINDDILKVDIDKIINMYPTKKVKIVANLPYYITTPIIMNILENELNIDSIIVMIQKEVAYRISATVGTKDYGALSLIVQYFCEPHLIANVPQNCFIPRPNVDSAVIKLDILKTKPVSVKNKDLMFKLIKIAFSQRRKTLINCIFNSKEFNLKKENIIKILNSSNLNEKVRGEDLSLKDFAKLTNIFIENIE